jgi:hypothetical protein
MLGRGPHIQVVTLACPHVECDGAPIEVLVNLAARAIEEATSSCPHAAALAKDEAFLAEAVAVGCAHDDGSDREGYDRAVNARIDALREARRFPNQRRDENRW